MSNLKLLVDEINLYVDLNTKHFLTLNFNSLDCNVIIVSPKPIDLLHGENWREMCGN